MDAKVMLVHKHRKIPDSINISIPEPYEDIAKYVLDTREMKFEVIIMRINKVGLTYKSKTLSVSYSFSNF